MHKDTFSKAGFVLAAIGSAVGLGNIWKFPYMTGDNGGGVFVLIYLVTIVFIGMALFIAETIMGSKVGKDATTIFETLAPKKTKKYWKLGGFTIITGLVIAAFYPIVLAWILHYVYMSFFSLPQTMGDAETQFLGLLGEQVGVQLFYYTISFIFMAYTLSLGVKKGIEKLNNLLMPTLVVILAILFVYSIQLDGFEDAVKFMFQPNLEKFNSTSMILAVGHAFFTLSVGMAIILTYSASINKEINIVKTSVIVVVMDTLIAITAGIVIFAVLFSQGHEAGKGAGLVFITLPVAFYEMGTIGTVLSILFFLALTFAAFTSAVSIIEPSVRYLIERKGMKRAKAAYLVCTVLYVVGFVILLSHTKDFSANLTFGGKNLFDWFDFVSSAILLPIGGIAVAIFVGYFMDKEILKQAIVPHSGITVYRVWLFCIKFIAPISVFFVLLFEAGLFKF